MDQTWVQYGLDCAIALVGFLGARQISRMDRDRIEQNKKAEKQDEKIDALAAEAAASIIGLDNLKNDHSETKGRLTATADKVDTNHSLVRDSLHDIRTLIGTKYLTREEFQDFMHTVSDKMDKINTQIPVQMNAMSVQITTNIRQMLSDMGVGSRRTNDP